MSKLGEIVYSKPKLKSSVILIAYIALMVLAAVIFSRYVSKDALQEIVRNTGQLGILVYFLIETVYVVFTPLWNTAILIFSGYLFGGHLGFVINFLATSAGLFIIVFLVKRYGRPLLKRMVSSEFYERFDKITEKVGPIILLIVYVLPFAPDDELTYIAAAGPVGFKRFILPVILGTIAKAAYSYIGDLGTKGITIAVYFRVVLLIVGLMAVGLQEYVIRRRNHSRLIDSES